MSPATGWLVLAAWLLLAVIAAWLVIGAAIDLTDTIRAWRNDRADARDVDRRWR